MINNLFHAFKSPFMLEIFIIKSIRHQKEPAFNFFNVLLLFLNKRLIYAPSRFLRCIFELRYM